MFYQRFTKFSRPQLGFVIAFVMLFAPALALSSIEAAAQKNKAKPAPTPKKKATPDKKTQAKTKPTPKPDPKSKSKSRKDEKQTASKNAKNDRRSEKNAASKNTASKNDRRSNNKSRDEKNKNSRTADRRNSKQNLAANNKIPSKSSKNERRAKEDERRARADERRRSSRSTEKTTSKTVKPTVAKTTPKPKTERKTETPRTTRTAEKTAEKTVETPNAPLSEVIVSTFSVPVRSQASPSAPMLSNVKLGTVLRVAEKKPEWYKVQYLADGQTATGWIAANAANDLNGTSKTDVYRQIVERNYKPQMDFQTASEFYQFASKVGSDLDGSEKSAEIELRRLLALRAALRTIPGDSRENAPYKDFLRTQEKEIVYNEPAGEWLVASNEFWNLHRKYKKMPVADAIAWEAANNPLPGECEGYVNCYLFDMRMRFGEYLNLHPNGKNAGEALRSMTDYLSPIAADAPQKAVYNGPTDVTDRAEFNNLIAELRTIVARLQFVEKEKTLQQLRTIAEAYR